MENYSLINQIIQCINERNIPELRHKLVDYIYSQCVIDADEVNLKEWKINVINDYVNEIIPKIKAPKNNSIDFGRFFKFTNKEGFDEDYLSLKKEAEKALQMCNKSINRINTLPLVEKENILEKNVYTERTPLKILEELMKLIGYTSLYLKKPDIYLDSVDNSIDYITKILNKEGYTIINYSDNLSNEEKEQLFDYLIKNDINEVVPQYPALIEKENSNIILKGWIYVPEHYKLD